MIFPLLSSLIVVLKFQSKHESPRDSSQLLEQPFQNLMPKPPQHVSGTGNVRRRDHVQVEKPGDQPQADHPRRPQSGAVRHVPRVQGENPHVARRRAAHAGARTRSAHHPEAACPLPK